MNSTVYLLCGHEAPLCEANQINFICSEK